MAGYNAVHMKIMRLKGAAKLHKCSHCDNQAEQWACFAPEHLLILDRKLNLHYCNNVIFYMPLCRKCHARLDGHKGTHKYDGDVPICKKGHRIEGDNVFVYGPRSKRPGKKECLTCKRDRHG